MNGKLVEKINIVNKKLIFYIQQILNYRAMKTSIQNMYFLKVNNTGQQISKKKFCISDE